MQHSFVEPITALQKHFCLLRQKPPTVPLYADGGFFLVCVCFSQSNSLSKKSIFLISRAISLSLCERSVAHLPDALLALTFRHPCLQPKPLPLVEGLCMLGGLCISAFVVVCGRCIVHRLCSTTCKHPCLEPFGIHARHPCRAYYRGLKSEAFENQP